MERTLQDGGCKTGRVLTHHGRQDAFSTRNWSILSPESTSKPHQAPCSHCPMARPPLRSAPCRPSPASPLTLETIVAASTCCRFPVPCVFTLTRRVSSITSSCKRGLAGRGRAESCGYGGHVTKPLVHRVVMGISWVRRSSTVLVVRWPGSEEWVGLSQAWLVTGSRFSREPPYDSSEVLAGISAEHFASYHLSVAYSVTALAFFYVGQSLNLGFPTLVP